MNPCFTEIQTSWLFQQLLLKEQRVECSEDAVGRSRTMPYDESHTAPQQLDSKLDGALNRSKMVAQMSTYLRSKHCMEKLPSCFANL